MSRADEITDTLRGLKDRHPEIEACMVAKRGLEGIIVFPETFKDDVAPIWGPLSASIDDMLGLVSRHSESGLEMTYMQMLGFGGLFLVLDTSDTALIALIRGADGMEKARNMLPDMELTRKKILTQ
jgi:hypothetical protein